MKINECLIGIRNYFKLRLLFLRGKIKKWKKGKDNERSKNKGK